MYSGFCTGSACIKAFCGIVTCIGGADIGDTYSRSACIDNISAGQAYARSAYISGVCVDSADVVECLEIHSQSFQILKMMLFNIRLEIGIEVS